MHLKSIELAGFKSFAKKDVLHFTTPISGIVGPNGSGKSNTAEAFRFVLGEQSMKSMRGKRGEDLIFNGSPTVSRANRAAVKVTFDNTKRFLDIDYDEVTIGRVVHRDGTNQYAINGSQVRLKDITELLAGANIGSSGHHIISQGEADRVLSANPRERREMVEDALGLKVYQYKKQESEKKLEKTQENIVQVESLRKEITPHLKFLERQVQKIQKTLEMKEDLKGLYADYLKREELYITWQTKDIAAKRKEPHARLKELDKELVAAKDMLEQTKGADQKSQEVVTLESSLSNLRKQHEELSRTLGRTEGQMAFEEARIKAEEQKLEAGLHIEIPLSDVEHLTERISSEVAKAEQAEDLKSLRSLIAWVRDALREFVSAKREALGAKRQTVDTTALEQLQTEQADIQKQLATLTAKETETQAAYDAMRKEIESEKDESRAAEREVFRISTEQSELRATLQQYSAREEMLRHVEEDFKREIAEGIVLVGKAIEDYRKHSVTTKSGVPIAPEEIASEERSAQEERRRAIEKIKIRLEEAGGANSDEIIKEHKEVSERDAFFVKELADLAQSAESLRQIIKELEEKLDTQFKEGLKKINDAFQDFFAILFGGGTAKMNLVKQTKRGRATDELAEDDGLEEIPEDVYEGLEVAVSLAHKRVKGLEMLSGGERALTSIALIFAMSQVNPPPFIILDETDAALDEANSKRYGDMIESLAKKSQLILITHNRETMSRAGVLYGVTMGSDGISKLLSIKLEEAVQVAK